MTACTSSDQNEASNGKKKPCEEGEAKPEDNGEIPRIRQHSQKLEVKGETKRNRGSRL